MNYNDQAEASSVRVPNTPIMDVIYDGLEKATNDARDLVSKTAADRNRANDAYEDAVFQLRRLEAAEIAITGRDEIQTRDVKININNPLNVPVDRRYGIPVDGGAIKRG